MLVEKNAWLEIKIFWDISSATSIKKIVARPVIFLYVEL